MKDLELEHNQVKLVEDMVQVKILQEIQPLLKKKKIIIKYTISLFKFIVKNIEQSLKY